MDGEGPVNGAMFTCHTNIENACQLVVVVVVAGSENGGSWDLY